MSEWAYKNCTCGNRVHINTTCHECNADPWGVRKRIESHLKEQEKLRIDCKKELRLIARNIADLKEDLKKSYHKIPKEL